MKRIWTASLLLSVSVLAACGVSSSDSTGALGEPRNAGPGNNSGKEASSSSSGSGSISSSSSSGGAGDGESTSSSGSLPAPGSSSGQQQAGTLTAGVWDDNLNFDFFKKYLELNETTGTMPSLYNATERDLARQKWLQRTGANELDITFLVDTTGSMGDELSYLQTEIDDIATTLKAKFPTTTPRYGLVLYKDNGDAYVTRWFDFKSLEEFRSNLANQSSGGGGDYPEAVAEGLDQTMKLSWREGAVSRMAFWVADAPHHAGQEQLVRTAIDAAVAKDVHVYPVASSNSDALTEHTMRTAAQITGGRYVFLTDDSGVGNSHEEPHIPCYHVTKFNQAVVRMVESEMKATHIAPDPTQIIRTVGSPTNGQCATKTQGNVSIY